MVNQLIGIIDNHGYLMVYYINIYIYINKWDLPSGHQTWQCKIPQKWRVYIIYK
jgi:hypothetical protein